MKTIDNPRRIRLSWSTEESFSMSTTRQKVEVIVIGAGIAGLAAARDLSIDGYDVLVLEARNRIGGRIWTSRDLGVPTDLGASWIHGFEDNPISRLAKRHGIEILRTDISSVSPAPDRLISTCEADPASRNDLILVASETVRQVRGKKVGVQTLTVLC
jgi:NADPH-dependent 2,4-dienoyl-CoA reductase/sulfur reductase-like enzyme